MKDGSGSLLQKERIVRVKRAKRRKGFEGRAPIRFSGLHDRLGHRKEGKKTLIPSFT